MKRRLIGVVVAVLLAALGTAALVGYVQAAKNRVVANEALVDVYVVEKKVPKGSGSDAIKSAVRLDQVPGRLKQPDAITDLADVGEQVATVDLLPADQLVRSRLGSLSETAIGIPSDRMTISMALEPERAVGGTLRPGDTVGVFLSFEPFEADASGNASAASTSAPRKTPNMTHLQFQKVLVTDIRILASGSGPTLGGASTKQGDESLAAASQDKLLVTLALTPPEAEQLVFAVEFGHVWLANQPATVSEDGTRIVTLGNAYAVKAR